MSASYRKSLAVSWILVMVLAVFSTYFYIDSQQRYQALQEGYRRLESQAAGAQTELTNMRAQLEALRPTAEKVNRTIVVERVSGENFTAAVNVFNSAGPSVILVTVKTKTALSLRTSGGGSGFIYDKAGHIITNNHVVEAASAIQVTFPDGGVFEARLVGRDPYSDLAVVKIGAPQDRLKPLPLGDSSKLMVGQRVLAIGNPFGLSNSMTEGIVSQLGRELPTAGGYSIVDVIQVDAAVNPGNSGGPLMSLEGKVVGVNTALISPTGSFVGVGFAIPIDLVKKVIPKLIATGQYKHPWLGIASRSLSPEIAELMNLKDATGTLVLSVAKNGPAEKAGVRGGDKRVVVEGEEIVIGGDVIIAVDGEKVQSTQDILVYMQRNKEPGDAVTLTVIRGGKTLKIDVVLGERPLP